MTVEEGSGRRRGFLFTDLYQLVMAQSYVADGLGSRDARFDYFYRSNPDYGSHQAGFCVFAGSGPLAEWLATVAITDEELTTLADQRTPAGTRRFDDDFLGWLRVHGHFRDLTITAIGEGRVVHPHEPLVTVTGPLAQAQLLETGLLNWCNYPTLVATKAARIVQAAQQADVLEFGMRRGPASGVDEAARAALIGGCSATSNVQATAALGTDPRGTHAHSFVQAHMAIGDGELGAFRAFAARYPDECVLLVDTIDTIRSGVPNAITVFEELRAEGHEPAGIRLDSGDLAHLAVRSARMLDDAGFGDVRIVLSSDLDEMTIWQILTQIGDDAPRHGVDPEAVRRRLVYGVGTRLITSEGDGALGGVYKLTAITDATGSWVPALKRSENPVKTPIVGPNRLWRLTDRRGAATVDLLTEADETPFDDGDEMTVHHPHRPSMNRTISRDEIGSVEALHEPLAANDPPIPVAELAERARVDQGRLDPGVRRLVNPHTYHVSLSSRLQERMAATLSHVQDMVPR